MFDFYFGTREEIAQDEKKFLLSVKRMLPRWVNSIPDSEYLAIYDSLESLATKSAKPVIAETGAGASTIVLLYYAMKHSGILYSWDFHAEKGAYLRGVCLETLSAALGKNVLDHWKFIAFDSKSPHLGVPILKDLETGVDFCFLDSEHTLNQLLAELRALKPLLHDGAIVAIDDANYDFRHTNESYINVFRKKLGLPPIAPLPENRGRTFFEEVGQFLKENWDDVEYLADSYKENYKDDLFWSYFKADREIMSQNKMEKMESLDHRYDSWRVKGRKS